MSNELAPDSRQSVDLKWKLRKALEKNVAPSDDGKGLDFGQDVTVDGKLHLNELSDIVGPDGSALFTNDTQENVSSEVDSFLNDAMLLRFSGSTIAYETLTPIAPILSCVRLGKTARFDGAYSYTKFIDNVEEAVLTVPAIVCPRGAIMTYLFRSSEFKGKVVFSNAFAFSEAFGMFWGSNVGEVDGGGMGMIDACYMFRDCRNLKKVSNIDFSDCVNMNNCFKNCVALTSIDCTGFKVSFDVTDTALEHDALVALINSLETVTTAQTLTMGEAKLALLSDEEKLGATNKGWTLA